MSWSADESFGDRAFFEYQSAASGQKQRGRRHVVRAIPMIFRLEATDDLRAAGLQDYPGKTG